MMFVSHQAKAYPRHWHAEYVIGVMEQGVEALHLTDASYEVWPGDMILLAPDQPHANAPLTDARYGYRVFYIPPDLVEVRLGIRKPGAGYRASFDAPVVSRASRSRTLLSLHRAALSNLCSVEARFWRVLAELFAVHHQWLEDAGDAEVAIVADCRKHLEASYAKPIRLSDLAAAAGVGPFQLLRAFQRTTGLTPAQYQTQLRLDRAKSLLRSGEAIAEVALEVGFSDQSHLNRRFQKTLSLTPGQYAARKIVQDPPSSR